MLLIKMLYPSVKYGLSLKKTPLIYASATIRIIYPKYIQM